MATKDFLDAIEATLQDSHQGRGGYIATVDTLQLLTFQLDLAENSPAADAKLVELAKQEAKDGRYWTKLLPKTRRKRAGELLKKLPELGYKEEITETALIMRLSKAMRCILYLTEGMYKPGNRTNYLEVILTRVNRQR